MISLLGRQAFYAKQAVLFAKRTKKLFLNLVGAAGAGGAAGVAMPSRREVVDPPPPRGMTEGSPA